MVVGVLVTAEGLIEFGIAATGLFNYFFQSTIILRSCLFRWWILFLVTHHPNTACQKYTQLRDINNTTTNMLQSIEENGSNPGCWLLGTGVLVLAGLESPMPCG